jgi:acyl-CoA reductase-like NAD-dependent aldehyde dehydrogenase
MRGALLQLPMARTANERRNVLRAAIRQLERADLYLAAVVAMELDDRQARRTVDRLRRDLEWLRRHLVDLRSVT